MKANIGNKKIANTAISITTTEELHDVYNDFNYDYFKIGNTINNRSNKISVSLPCKIELRYSPIIKDSPQ